MTKQADEIKDGRKTVLNRVTFVAEAAAKIVASNPNKVPVRAAVSKAEELWQELLARYGASDDR